MNPARHKRVVRVLAACVASVGLLAAVTLSGPTRPSDAPTTRPGVTELRFGVVEPPVVAQSDITIRFATSNQQFEKKPLECSGMAWVDGRLILSSDRHQHAFFTCAVDLAKMTIAPPTPHTIIRNEQSLLDDAECVTVRHRRDASVAVYMLCSLSNDRGERAEPKRRHMLRFTLPQSGSAATRHPTVISAAAIRRDLADHLKAVNVGPYRTYWADFPEHDKNTYRWGNVEGMTFTPRGSLLLCGMRNPLIEGKAILFLVRGVDDAFDAKDPQRLTVTDVFALDLGQRGVCDLCWDPVTKGYLIAAGKSNGPKRDRDRNYPPNSLDNALFWWSGRKSEKPRMFARTPDMKVEAVCRLGTSRYIAIGSDEGDVSEDRRERQSILTILDFTGLARSERRHR